MNRVKRQVILAAFWFITTFIAAGALIPWEWAWRCAWLNLIIGLLGLLLTTRTEHGDRLFYQGPRGDEPGSLLVATLWGLPVFWLALAILWWVVRLLGLFTGFR